MIHTQNFYYKIKELFRWREGPGQPIVFLQGSEQELRDVTKWICYIYPSLFRYAGFVNVRYWSTFNGKSGSCDVKFPRRSVAEYEYLINACGLAFRYNEFTGSRWVKKFSEDIYHHFFINPLRETVVSLEVKVTLSSEQQSPPAEEQREARRLLSAWLEGKISDEEKRELFPAYS